MQEIKERAKELLASGQVQRVLGWKRGEDLPYNPQPAFFENEAQPVSYTHLTLPTIA